MERFLDSLLKRSAAYHVSLDNGGFLLVGNPERAAEFNVVVRQAAANAGADFVAFPITDGGDGYSQMFIIPLREMPSDTGTL